MFIAFVKRGPSLPPKAFFDDLLAFYVIQLHHLGPNSISWIFAFTVLYEGYLGIHPRMSLWCAMFHLKQQKNLAKLMQECGVAATTKRELDYIWIRSSQLRPNSWGLSKYVGREERPEVMLAHVKRLDEEGLLGLDLLTSWIFFQIQARMLHEDVLLVREEFIRSGF
ncbi:hypothetical protein QYE76_018819 [Lolium multiflorum]|uniref:Transposase (putative) gypsy type domain-containing protein n=1 Tax=Lolium multiflorum TaxID=4521 RepID=A0AAD8QLX1_LOLMU|nr:hypothetical protein QYE76_018819 [Lolium multiflorum]